MAWFHRLFNVARPTRLARDIDREMTFHLAERVDELVAGGMGEAEARREARRRFGNPLVQRERTRDVDVLVWLESVLADLRFAARGLRRNPAFALVAILSLGLGIGANTAIFSLINAVVLRSLPVRHPEELVQIRLDENGDTFTNPLWEAFRDRQRSFSGVLAASEHRFNLAERGEARRVSGDWVSGDFFNVLGVSPAVGRLLGPADDVRGCPAVAALSYGLWQREFGGAPDVVGRSIALDRHRFEIVGVTPPGFFGVRVGGSTQVYVPLCSEAIVHGERSYLDHRSAWFLDVLGRPATGLTLAQVGAQLAALSPSVFEATVPPAWGAGDQAEYRATVLHARAAPTGLSELRGKYQGALFALLAVVGVVLLIACGNVANLLLARAAGRQHEMAIRRAIGSEGSRLVRQLITESLLLALLGAGVGLLLARWMSRLLVAFVAAGSSGVWLDLTLDGRVLGFTLAVSIVTGLLFGLEPARRSTRVAPVVAMRAGGRGAVGGGGRFAVGKALVIGQLALSLAVVMGAGLLLRTMNRLLTLDPGFERDGVLLVAADLSQAGFSEDRLRTADRELLERLRGLPGVGAAGASLVTPIGPTSWNDFVAAEGFTPAKKDDSLVWFNGVSDGYFATLETRLLAGRDFDDRDVAGSARVAVIDEAMARKFFGEPYPLGKSFHTDQNSGPGPELEVVGVVEDSKYGKLDEKTRPLAYVPWSQSEWFDPVMNFALRTDAPAALIPSVKREVAALEPSISLEVTTLSDQVAASLARPRLLAALSGFFGAVALLLSMIGLYGTLSYAVASRRGEIGVRLALGAAPARVLGMVLGEVGRMVVAGLLLGAAAALAATRLLSAFLFGVTPTDPRTLAESVAVLAAVAFLAGALPAWRAARLDPMTTLREE